MGSRFNPVSFYIPLPRCMVLENSKKKKKNKKKKKKEKEKEEKKKPRMRASNVDLSKSLVDPRVSIDRW